MLLVYLFRNDHIFSHYDGTLLVPHTTAAVFYGGGSQMYRILMSVAFCLAAVRSCSSLLKNMCRRFSALSDVKQTHSVCAQTVMTVGTFLHSLYEEK